MDTLQKENARGSEYISWHEGAHLIVKNPKGSPTFERVIDRLCEYFNIQKKSSGTRFNWYRDSSDWKPFHHDSAAYNEQRAKRQNTTVGGKKQLTKRSQAKCIGCVEADSSSHDNKRRKLMD